MVRLLVVLTLATAAQAGECTCELGNGSYLALRSPKAAPGDPDPCPAVFEGMHPPVRPAGNDACAKGTRMACFLRRHAASWRIECAVCATKPCCSTGKAPEGGAIVAFRESQRKLGGRDIEAAWSPRFVVVTDIGPLRMVTSGNGSRLVTKHEMLHLYLQRAEMARLDFEEVFGAAYRERSALVIVKSEMLRARFAEKYFRHGPTSLRRGYNSAKTIADGHACNGICITGRKDDDIHFRVRHMIGHLLMSTYHTASPLEKYLPKWVDIGCAHWLSKLHPRAQDFACFCLQEGGTRGRQHDNFTVSGSGKRWPAKAKKVARRGPERDPVEGMFTASTKTDVTLQMNIRAWSWFDTFTRHERDAFVQFIGMLRRAEEPRAAAKAAWGQSPEIVDQRWRDRVLARPNKVAASADVKESDAASSTELIHLSKETDLKLLASRIRGLERCRRVKTAKLLVSFLDRRDSDRVREVIALVLGRTDDAEVMAYLRGEGYTGAGPIGRATLCRAFGVRGDKDALPLLRKALHDRFWLVQANAARALAQIGDRESLSALTAMAESARQPKVRIAAMDALARFGPGAAVAVPRFERNLMHRAWQVKVATCEAFRAIGNRSAMEMLIGRLDAEGGRIHDEINRTLKALAGLDRDMNREEWRKWWAHQKKFAAIDKKLPAPKPPANRGTEARRTTKPPTYYGIRIYARTVGYVIDTSASMKQGFKVSDFWQKKLGHEYTADTRIGVCKEEIAQSIRSLDPRTRFNLVMFNDRARIWQEFPVPAGSMGENGVGTVESAQPTGQTNYYAALKAILGIPDEGHGWSAQFADTPDTLLFLTDGLPTVGEITKGDELLAWFNERNRFARLRVHVIAMGRAGVDAEFLAVFAKSNGGTFIHMAGG